MQGTYIVGLIREERHIEGSPGRYRHQAEASPARIAETAIEAASPSVGRTFNDHPGRVRIDYSMPSFGLNPDITSSASIAVMIIVDAANITMWVESI